MSSYQLSYGEKKLELDMPSNLVRRVIDAKPLPAIEDEETVVSKALSEPIGTLRLPELVKPAEKVCIVIGDLTRLWVRHDRILRPLLDELNRGGVRDSDITIISATGDHRPQSREEHGLLVGEEVLKRVRVIDHNARDREKLKYLGSTSRGTPVYLNRHALEADRLILTGGIVYHFLAGWGGGKKALLPGLAGYETIMKNHSLAFLPPPHEGLNPAVCAGVVEGNPCSDDMLEGAAMGGPDFLVNVIIDDNRHSIAYAVAGHYNEAFLKGCSLVDQHFSVTIGEPSEAVIASCGGYPKDVNFYQTYKTLYNAHFALRKGGTLILVSESREGLGSEDYAGIITGYRTNAEREKALRLEYTIGAHMGYHTAVLAEEHDILLLTKLPKKIVDAMGMIKINSLEEGIKFLQKKHGKVPPAYLMPHGGSTLPRACGDYSKL